MTAKLTGRIDSTNSEQTEREIRGQLGEAGSAAAILDAERLEYISSAGLRVILRLKKDFPDLKIVNVSSEVYEIFEMTGFTEMFPVEKAYKVVSVDGCEVIGEGHNGKVYRLDRDTVVKVYKNAKGSELLDEIQHEREVARLALILGVPTAISYDVVRVGDSFGSVFELLNARSFAKILAEEPEKIDWCVKEYVGMLKTIHGITVPEGKLPRIKDKAVNAVGRMKHLLPDGLGDKLERMVLEIPEDNHMVHGDYHTKNLELAGDEVLLIDMDTLSTGHPIFELSQMYNSYIGFSEYNPDIVLQFQGYPAAMAKEFWNKSVMAYLNTDNPERIREVTDKVRCLSYAMLIDWKNRHGLTKPAPDDPATLALWKERLIELLSRVDSLVFDVAKVAGENPNELTLEARTENLSKVAAFVQSRLEAAGCSLKMQMQIDVAVEEIFVNIANYAYTPEVGSATVRVEVSENPVKVSITFIDRGIPYDPLAKTDPDVSLSAEEREIGGLGIFMTKQLMDDVVYEYRDGQNILTLKKNL